MTQMATCRDDSRRSAIDDPRMIPRIPTRGLVLVSGIGLTWMLVTSSAAGAAAGGLASWYDDGPGYYAAVPSFVWGDAPYEVRVCRQDDSMTCVTVTVRDHCACRIGTPDERLIDLSPDAFEMLAPLSLGLVPVSYEDTLPMMTLPPTDAES